MNIFNHVNEILPIEMKAEMIDGKRYYVTPTGGKYPSITTVISNNSAKQASLAKWRARVGKEAAQASINQMVQLTANKRLDFELARLKNCGDLKIDDPRSSAAMCRPRQKEGEKPLRLLREYGYTPKEGRVIMFPSWLMHCVEPNESNDIRISVSFNFMQQCLMA